MDRFGRKKTLLATEIPLIIGWILIALAPDVHYIYAGRILCGLGSGMVGAPVSIHRNFVNISDSIDLCRFEYTHQK